jgi:hypothetical protein
MCELCHEIDIEIARYRRLANGINDRHVIERLFSLIADLAAEKSALHPAPDP